MSATKPIPLATRERISNDPFFKKCCRPDKENCSGRITVEHAIMYAGKRINDYWALLPLCWEHHLGQKLDKAWNIKTAMARATEEDRKKYPRLKWR